MYNESLHITLNHPLYAALERRDAFFYSILKQLKIEWVWQYVEENNSGRANTYHHNVHMKTMAVNCWEFFHVECRDKINDAEFSLEQLVIAACLHDMDHSGGECDDEENILRACAAVEMIEGSLDKQFYDGFGRKVQGLIRVTQFPFVYIPKTRLQKILRDCDAMQAYEPEGVTVIMEGLRMEMLGRIGHVPTYTEMYEGQIKFMDSVEYYTDTAKAIIEAQKPRLLKAFKAYADLRTFDQEKITPCTTSPQQS